MPSAATTRTRVDPVVLGVAVEGTRLPRTGTGTPLLAGAGALLLLGAALVRRRLAAPLR